MAIVFARKCGNSVHLCIPSDISRKMEIKRGDVFKLERDNLLPNNYSLVKVDSDC